MRETKAADCDTTSMQARQLRLPLRILLGKHVEGQQRTTHVRSRFKMPAKMSRKVTRAVSRLKSIAPKVVHDEMMGAESPLGTDIRRSGVAPAHVPRCDVVIRHSNTWHVCLGCCEAQCIVDLPLASSLYKSVGELTMSSPAMSHAENVGVRHDRS
jgi:hypothetical protein